MINILCTFYLMLLMINFSSCSLFGTECVIESTNTPGICKPLRECIQVKRDINKGIQPTKCGSGFEDGTAITCCPKETTITPRSSEPTTSKHHQKCVEYTTSLNYIITAQPLAIDAPPIISEVKKCGHEKIELIVGGTDAAPMEFPHSVLLGYYNGDEDIEWLCGGSLISPLFVLTAAHCTNQTVIMVRLGSLTRNKNEQTAQNIDVSEVTQHPDYKDPHRYNDIALLKLKVIVKFNEYIKPICLPDGNENILKSIATGWGKTKLNALTGSEILQKVILELFPQTECSQKVRKLGKIKQFPNGIVEKTQICAGSHTERKDTCGGDSGGPLQIYHPTVKCAYTQVGITSVGYRCAKINFPGFYTRLLNYVEWIEKIVWPKNDSL